LPAFDIVLDFIVEPLNGILAEDFAFADHPFQQLPAGLISSGSVSV